MIGLLFAVAVESWHSEVRRLSVSAGLLSPHLSNLRYQYRLTARDNGHLPAAHPVLIELDALITPAMSVLR